MRDFTDIIEAAKATCDEVASQYSHPDIASSIAAYEHSAENAGKAWSGSWLGYHSRVYYRDLQPIPPGARFSLLWGFSEKYLNPIVGDWVEYAFDDVYTLITDIGAKKEVPELLELAKDANDRLHDVRESLASVIDSMLPLCPDAYLEKLRSSIEKSVSLSASDYIKFTRPSGRIQSHDEVAIQAGFHTPPHTYLQAQVFEAQHPQTLATSLRKLAQQLSLHLDNKRLARAEAADAGTHIFIGHGQSLLWKDLKDFIKERLELPHDEFNRVPIAGVTNISRLSDMLKSAAIAFIVMTAEDEQLDGKLHARMNVIHEAGLFQGKLGFTRAIVVLEDGCEEFSNINGLGQIRFPKGNIKACFEEVREVLEREGLL